jgi:Xaa-Pro dipeptidase
MTIGVGGVKQEQALAELTNMTGSVKAIELSEYKARLTKAQGLIRENGLEALYINAGTNLHYFTGTRVPPSERMIGAILPAEGDLIYICPSFEIETLKGFIQIEGDIRGWEEHECSYTLVVELLKEIGINSGKIGIDESASFFLSDGLANAGPDYSFTSAKAVTAGCRVCKSENELALLQKAKDMTIEVHKATAKILVEGITTHEVKKFIHEAHIKVGATAGSSFCIVLFGVDSSFPHGVNNPNPLKANDVVLIDTGCLIEGYNSDITRTYIFGEPNERQREMWSIEKEAQAIAFNAAQLGTPCGDVDTAARDYLTSRGLGPGYNVPGCPHRTGHGVGLDIHEWPYLVKSDRTPLQVGMCFSNEPMLVLPDEFGIRLEDHFYMSKDGPKWFSEPAHSIDDPFGYEA